LDSKGESLQPICATKPRGTRNEYRLTCLTAYLRRNSAQAGDEIEISKDEREPFHRIRFLAQSQELPAKVILRGWRRVH